MNELCVFVAETLKVDPGLVTPESGPGVLAAWDSFQHLHLIMALEARYGIEIPVEQIVTLLTVRDIADLLVARGVSLA